MPKDESSDARRALRFVDQPRTFAYGYEAGMLASRMVMQEPLIESDIPYYTANLTTFDVMADYYGYVMKVHNDEALPIELASVTFTRKPTFTLEIIPGGRKDGARPTK